MPWGAVDQPAERAERLLVHAEILKREEDVRPVEDPHDDPFAKDHRDHAHAHVDLLAADLKLDPAVLRKPLLGDVHAREDFQTTDDRGLETVDLGRQRCFLKDSVDSVANLQIALEGFDVDVASTLAQRLDDDLVDELDDARFLRHLEEVLAVLLSLCDRGFDPFAADQLVNRVSPHSVVELDELVDLFLRCERSLDLQARQHSHLIERVEVERVARHHAKRPVAAFDRRKLLSINELRGDASERARVDLDLVQVDDRNGQFLADQTEERELGDDTQIEQDAVEPTAFALEEVGRTGELLVREQATIQ